MDGQRIEWRQCTSPQCGLRYPLVERNAFGERCPACLGETIVMAEGRIGREEAGERNGPGQPGLAALLDNVRSAWNVGSIFRSAAGLGVRHLYLCGITATPANEQVGKTALGADSMVPWTAHKNAAELAKQLQGEGCVIWALERTPQSAPLRAGTPDISINRVVLVVGNEQAGVDPATLKLADHVVHIEMQGLKRSFNVAVAFAVAVALLREKR